jgi:hypothetical protein
MKKLKQIIQESKYLKREFGDKLPTLSDVMNQHQDSKRQLNEWGDLYSHVKSVEQHIADFRKDIDRKRGGSFDADSVEYEDDRWHNNSKMLKGRDKKLGQWEKKVKKSLDNLIKDYEKAWK